MSTTIVGCYIFSDAISSLVLMTVCDKLGPYELDTGLKTIHGYLESRLLLLTSVPVSYYLACSSSVPLPRYMLTMPGALGTL